MELLLVFGALALFIVIGLPVAVSLAGSSLVYLLMIGRYPELVVLHRMVEGVDNFPLLAVPLFIFAGNLMNSAGITNRIFSFANAIVGWLRGGLGHVNVIASVIFAGMSGAAVADAGGLGTIEIKAMKDAGYDGEVAVAITAASSTIGPIIPPSLPMVIYGVQANESISRLFLAGIFPGLLMALSLMILISWYAKTRNYPRGDSFSAVNLWKSFRGAFLSLLTPIIIVGGILAGVFTPTEAAAAASAYALFLGTVVYRTLNLRRLMKVTLDSIETAISVLFIVAAATVFAWVLTRENVTQELATFLLGMTSNKILILLLFNVLFLVVGFFMETVAAIIVLVPVLLPVVLQAGIDPAHFGIIMVLNLMIGLLTPPVGVVLYVLSGISKIPFERCVRATLPFLLPLAIVLIIVVVFPQVSLFIPDILLGK